MRALSELPIGLGDLIRALYALEAGPEEARRIARLLGLAVEAPRELGMREAIRSAGAASAAGPASRRPPSAVPRPPPKPEREAAAPSPSSPISRLAREDLPATGATYPKWLPSEGMPLKTASSVRKAARQGLFEPRTTRALLQAILATRVPTDELDVTRLVDDLASRRSVTDLPRLAAPSLRRGVQVLVDRSEGMLPFLLDAEELVARLSVVVSLELTRVLHFRGDPSLVQSESAFEPAAYEPPPVGTPVLLVSDLGIGQRSARRPFVRFAQRLAQRGYSVTAVVPYPRERWPAELEALITLLPWDRRTNLRTIRLRRGRRA